MDFLSYALSLSPSVLSIPRLGHLNTLDGYNRAVTVAGSPNWSSSFNGMAFNPIVNGRYSIAHGAEQLFTDQTVFVHFSEPYRVNGAIQYIVSKYTGAAAWILLTNSVGTVQVYNSTLVTATIPTIKPIGNQSICFRSIGSSTVDFFYDGTFVEQEVGIDFSTQPSVPIIVGTTPGGAQSSAIPIDCVSIFPSVLTDQQISDLHTSFDQLIVAPEPKITYFIPEKDTKGAVIDMWGSPNANNIISDKSATNNNITKSNNLSFISNEDGGYYETYGQGDGVLTIPSNASFQGSNYNSYVFNGLQIKSNGEGGSGRLLEKQTVLNSYFSTIASGGSLYLVQYFSGGASQWNTPYFMSPHQLIILQDKTNPLTDPRFIINGTEVTPAQSINGSGSVVTDVGSNQVFGNRPTLGREGDFKLDQYKFYNSMISDSDWRDEYVKFALGHYRNLTPRFEHPVTLSAVSAPGHVGPWQTWAGSHEYLDDGVERYVKSSSANNFKSLNLKMGYGALYFKIYRGSGAGFGHIIFLLGERGDVYYTSSLQSGYMIFLPRADNSIALYKITSGVPVSIGNSGPGYLPSSGIYKFFISRRLTDGRFSLYTKEVNHSTWNLAFNSSADNSHTSGNYIQSYSRDALESREYDFLYWPYGDSLTPDDVDFIAD